MNHLIWNQGAIQTFSQMYSYRQLNDAFNDLVRRQDSLLVRFKETESDAYMTLQDFEYIDYPFVSVATDEELEAEVKKVLNQPIDLSDRLVNCTIFQTPTTSGLIINSHHIIVDGYSGLVMAEHINNYLKNPNCTPHASCTYQEYVEKEHQYKLSKRFIKNQQFWLEQFAGEPVCSIFNKDTSSLDFSASEIDYDFPEEFYSKIKSFAKKHSISLVSFFNMVYSVYFNRIYDVNNFTIGAPVLNRTTQDELHSIGLYMHMLPMIVNLSEDSFLENIKGLDNAHLNLLRYQKFTQHDIIETLKDNGKNISTLFDVVADYEEYPKQDDYDINVCYNETLSVPMEIHFFNMTDKHQLKIRYRKSVFTEKEIQTMMSCVISIIKDALENPNKKVKEINMVSDNERKKIFSFNDTFADYAKDKCIHELFEEQVAQTPDKTAIVAADKTLSYRELNEEANAIAHSLIDIGIGKGDIVGLMLPRKSYLLSALLGILKTGAAYLPIDPDLPEERTKYILTDSGARLCVTENNIVELLGNENTEKPDVHTNSSDICYCIYTSGSTGLPKGTLITHRNVANYVNANDKNVYYGILDKNCKRILSVTTIGFDIFVTESLLPLSNGLEIILADEEQSTLQNKLAELIEKHPADIIQTTPTKMRALTSDKNNVDYIKAFRTIILGGEALDKALVKELRKITDADIYNIYGPTETTVWITKSKIENPDDITIGKPMANTKVYILDKYSHLTPVGVTGELCIAGDSVSVGYLNNEELTAEKFIDNPFGEGKLYRTGDLAYWREDGNIVYVGRSDFQVKIRGLRIELGEIESTIRNVDGVLQCAVTVRKDKSDRQLICAFYTGKYISTGKLREVLGKTLPGYMIPHIFTHIENIPVTASGKTDRNALPEIDLESISTETEYIAPSTQEEIILTECIRNVLDKEKISVLDNFFDIGGDSLKSIELTAALEEKGYTAATKAIFSAKTIQELATKLEVKEAEEVTVEYCNVLPATAAQMRVYTAQMRKPDSTLYNITYAFRTEKADRTKLEAAVNKLIERHESLRTHFENIDGRIVQVIDETATITAEEITEDQINSFAKPFDLSQSPLVRAGLTEETVVISFHHIAVDGESMPVFFRELNELYMGRELSDLTTQYGSFAATDRYTEENEKYWLDVFDEVPASLELPTDYPRSSEQSFEGCNIYKRIDKNLHERIEDRCKEAEITPYVYYMACLNILFSKLSGNEDIVTGTPVSGRPGKHLNTIGMFVNTVALRSRPEGNKTIAELFEEIKNSSINAIENQNYPFNELVKKLNTNSSERNPLFDVMFAYQSFEMTDITFADKKAELLPLVTESAKCDITFNILPREEDVVLSVVYCTGLFKEKTVSGFAEMYIELLEKCLDDKKYIRDISVTDTSLIERFNDTYTEYEKDKCIHELFEEQVAQTPDKTAIVAADKTLSYRELNEEANRIAHSLIDIGIGKGDIVGLMLPRKSYLLSALLGILKTGAAYLPVDMEQPEERIKHILSDSNAKFCISEENLNNLLESSCTQNIINTATSDDFCYCIYTSGSTGLPKGTLLYHRNLVWYMSVLKNIYGTDNINMPFFTSPCVDLTVPSLYLPLLTGGTIYIYNGELKDDLLDIFNNDNLNILKFTPTHIGLVNKLIPSKPRPNIRCIIVGGESFSRASCIEFLNKFGHHIEIHNEYGPTETTVSCTDYIFDPNKNTDGVYLPIGSVVNNAQIYITDKHMQPVPLGVTGEICIAGDGVGAGYVNNPDLTSEKFICNPFGKGKLYKTGDLAYWCEDGNIMFAGRKDFQVKIRGFRVELEEIENAISKIDGIILSAVIVKEDKQSRHIICAFYTGEKKTEKQLREILRQTLPNYMIPHIFTHLEEIPMTTSGKISRNELPEFNLENIDIETEYVAPETAEERALFDVLCSVLNINNVNLAENFFNIGGDSIKAIYIVSELEEKGFELHVSDIMQQDTLLGAAKLIKSNSSKMIYDQNEVNGFIPFTPIMNAYIENNGKIANDFFHTCMISIDCDENTAIRALDAIISHHDILRGTISESGIEIHSSLESKAYSFQAITLNNCDEIKEYLNNITLTDSELINVVFFSTDKEHFLGISIHHFLIDLISWEILAEDLLAVIKQIKSNSKIKLPQKTASFKMWCEETQKYSESITNETKTYWKNVNDKLDNAQTLDLKEICSEKTESTHFVLDESTTKELINNANHKYGTKTNELLLTALGLAAAEIADGYVGIIVESHGRTELDKPIAIDRTVGWFTSCYPVIIHNNSNIIDELISVKETLRKTPRSGIDYLLSSQKFHKNASIKFNFYESRTDSKYASDQLKSFAFNGSVFKNKINVDCSLTKNVLTITISVPKNEHNIQLVEQLGISFKEKLENFITICTDNPEIIKTCSDFSDDELTEAELDELKDLFDWTDNYEQQH